MRIVIASLTALLLLGASAQAGVIAYSAILDGPSESPPNASPGTGFAHVTVDDVANTMRVEVNFSGLVAPNTAAHIHCCTTTPFVSTAIVATVSPTFTGFPPSTTSGSYDHTFDMTLSGSYNGAFITANGGTVPSAEAALFAGMAAGRAYLNIHSTTFGGGEIRGFLVADVPEPGTFLIAGMVLAGIGLLRRRR